MTPPERPAPGGLLLEDGAFFPGEAFGAWGEASGEVVFNTSLTGYQEVLTDPSYRAQIVVLTCPHVGNCGVNPADAESGGVQAAALVVREACPQPSSWRAAGALAPYLRRHGVVGLSGVDTRALVRHLRTRGVMRGAVVSGATAPERLREVLAREPPMEGRDLAAAASCAAPYPWTQGLTRLAGEAALRPRPRPPERPYRVAAYDFGVKRNLLRHLVDQGCEVTVYPARTPAARLLAAAPDGVFLSNGPGDPAACGYAVDNIRTLLGRVPLFGVCLGHQLAALALGARTYKLKFGHRGGNQPVRDARTGRVEITSQNHGFAVDADTLPADVVATHVNLNDGTNEGLGHRGYPLFTVQYHPEASPGPHDAGGLFARFRSLMDAHR